MKLEADPPVILIQPEAREKINHWVRMAKGEVSGLGLVEGEQGWFMITEVFLPFQSCGSADTVIEVEQVAQLMLEVEAQGHDPARLKFWWHSHAGMQVFWSTTDHDTIRKFRPSDFFVSCVFNKRGESLTRLDYYQPFRVSFLDLALEVNLPEYGQEAECRRLFDTRVRENTFDYRAHDFFPESTGSRVLIDPLEREELINRYCRGELDWKEAEALMEQGELFGEYEPWE